MKQRFGLLIFAFKFLVEDPASLWRRTVAAGCNIKQCSTGAAALYSTGNPSSRAPAQKGGAGRGEPGVLDRWNRLDYACLQGPGAMKRRAQGWVIPWLTSRPPQVWAATV